VAATCVNLPFSDNSFDTVVASEIIEHVNYNDGKMLLKEAKRILKPQGKLIISTPNLSNPYVKFLQIKRKMRARKNIEHLKEYTKKEFAGSISAYFRIIHLDSDVYLPIIPKINRFIKIPTCYNYCVAEKI
jgi:predicted SAM-dependent methyltransferase